MEEKSGNYGRGGRETDKKSRGGARRKGKLERLLYWRMKTTNGEGKYEMDGEGEGRGIRKEKKDI